MYFRMMAIVLASVLLAPGWFPAPQAPTYDDTLKLLRSLKYRKDDRETLAALFQHGDARIGDLIKALNELDKNISLNAQIVIRYLGNQRGMKALEEWYAGKSEILRSGPIPLPISDRDYSWFSGQPLRELESGAVYALALDRSPKAQNLLKQLFAVYDENVDRGIAAGEALKRIKAGYPKALKSKGDLAALVLKNAFFVDPKSRKYASARLLGMNGTKDKALIEVYVNRGALAEEWYHVVLSKCGPSWKFFSITQVAVS